MQNESQRHDQIHPAHRPHAACVLSGLRQAFFYAVALALLAYLEPPLRAIDARAAIFLRTAGPLKTFRSAARPGRAGNRR